MNTLLDDAIINALSTAAVRDSPGFKLSQGDKDRVLLVNEIRRLRDAIASQTHGKDDRATEEGDMRVRDVLTLRDHFAGLAMSALLSVCQHDSLEGITYPEHCAGFAYKVADEMLRARLA